MLSGELVGSELLEGKLQKEVIKTGGGGINEEKDPTVPEYVKEISEKDIENWNQKADLGYVQMIENIARGANQSLSFKNYEEMIQGIYNSKYDYNIGQNIMILTLEVPDLWISYIDDRNSVYYEYTTDDNFINELKTNGKVQIGYYFVSALETQKVDLTDYLHKNSIKLTLKDNGAYTLTINKE